MAWTNPTTRSSGYLVTAANWNELVNNMKHLMLVNHTQFTADVSVTATTVGTANQVVSAGAVTYENVPHLIEFYCPFFAGAVAQTFILVRDSTTVLGTIGRISANQSQVMKAEFRVTPTAASHTYNIAAYLAGAGTATANAGTGGTAGDATTDLAGFIRITRDPV